MGGTHLDHGPAVFEPPALTKRHRVAWRFTKAGRGGEEKKKKKREES